MIKKIFIDGIELDVDGAKTVLQIAREFDIYIPSICDHPQLGSTSMCRVCVVEVEGTKILQPACSIIPDDGMKISTKSRRVVEERKTAMNLLLANGGPNSIYL